MEIDADIYRQCYGQNIIAPKGQLLADILKVMMIHKMFWNVYNIFMLMHIEELPR